MTGIDWMRKRLTDKWDWLEKNKWEIVRGRDCKKIVRGTD